MDLDGVSLLGGEIDKSKIPPIEQKRILAFVNHFILTTCTFLNDFLRECESKFINVERKLQKVEAALIILEEKLASIPNTDEDEPKREFENKNEETSTIQERSAVQITNIQEPIKNSEETILQTTGVKAIEDARYRKYFKMVQFGVPPPAVKLKMISEGLCPDVLDTPNLILADGVVHETHEIS